VFVCLATLLVIAAGSVNLLGPEAKQRGLDDIAPPTNTSSTSAIRSGLSLPAECRCSCP